MSENDARQALASAVVYAGLREALSSSSTVELSVSAGQLWRVRLDDVALVVLTLSEPVDSAVEVLVVTVSATPPPDSAVATVLLPSDVLRRAVAWSGVRDRLPLRTFDTRLEASEPLRTDAENLRRADVPDVDRLDPGALLQAELQDELAALATSPGLPVRDETGVALKDKLPGDGAGKLQLLREALDVPQHEAMALLRGTKDLTSEDAAVVETSFGLDAGTLTATAGFRRDVVVELDQPRHKAAIVELSQRRG